MNNSAYLLLTMRLSFWAVLFVLAPSNSYAQTLASPRTSSLVLERASWVEAERALTADAVVVITLGAGSKAHGPHLPLATDLLQAEYVKERVIERTSVVVAPTINYGYYPPFTEYPGSTTVRLSVLREMVADVCRSIARSSNARRFYVISHGVISIPAMQQVQNQLEAEGLVFRFLDWERAKSPAVATVEQQVRGSHADEIETSILLHVAPHQVDMTKAVKEFGTDSTRAQRAMGNRPAGRLTYSASGIFGDPTLATAEKGKLVIDAVVAEAVKNIEQVRRAPLPQQPPIDTYFAEVVGRYVTEGGDTIAVSRDGKFLVVQQTSRPKARLELAGRYRFGLWTMEARFFRSGTRGVAHMILSSEGEDLVARRISTF